MLSKKSSLIAIAFSFGYANAAWAGSIVLANDAPTHIIQAPQLQNNIMPPIAS